MHHQKFARPLWESYDSCSNFLFSFISEARRTHRVATSLLRHNILLNYTQPDSSDAKQKAIFSNFKPGSSFNFPCHLPVSPSSSNCAPFSQLSQSSRGSQVGSMQISLFSFWQACPCGCNTPNRRAPRCRRSSVNANGPQATHFRTPILGIGRA